MFITQRYIKAGMALVVLNTRASSNGNLNTLCAKRCDFWHLASKLYFAGTGNMIKIQNSSPLQTSPLLTTTIFSLLFRCHNWEH